MALAVLDGNQSATTLSSVVTGGEHIVAHSVVSLGSNAISNITTAVSGSVVTIPTLNILARSVATEGIADSTLNFVKIGGHQDGSNQTAHIVHVSGGGAMKVDASDSTVTFGAISGTVTIGNTVTIAGTVTANPTGTQTIAGTVTANVFGKSVNGSTNYQIPIIGYDEDITAASDQYVVPVQISSLNGSVGSSNPLPISGTVTANNLPVITDGEGDPITSGVPIAFYDGSFDVRKVVGDGQPLPVTINPTGTIPAISGTVTIGSALPTGTNRIGVVTIGAGTVTIGAGTAQIGSVTASISNSLTIASLPALVAGTAQIGSVTASISNSVTIGSLPAISGTVTANLAISSSAITSGSFTSLTSATLVPANTARKMATVYNLGAGQLFINAGATATTLGGGFMVALSSGDFFECNYTTTTLSAIFATAGTASWMSH